MDTRIPESSPPGAPAAEVSYTHFWGIPIDLVAVPSRPTDARDREDRVAQARHDEIVALLRQLVAPVRASVVRWFDTDVALARCIEANGSRKTGGPRPLKEKTDRERELVSRLRREK